MQIGDKSKIAFVVGERSGADLWQVNIYIDNELVTYFDNTVYIPQFIASLDYEALCLEGGNVNREHIFLNWGPTTDDTSVRGVLENNLLQLNCELRNGKNLEIKLPLDYVLSTYRNTLNALRELRR